MGIKEVDFWEMTIDEIQRELNGIEYRYQLQAYFDYTLADLIGISVSRCLSKQAKFPHIEEVYPSLFEKSDIQEEKAAAEEEKQIAGFLALVEKHNLKRNNIKDGDDL